MVRRNVGLSESTKAPNNEFKEYFLPNTVSRFRGQKYYNTIVGSTYNSR